MILGSYPCCGRPLMLTLQEGPLPRFAPDTCEHCGAAVWHRFSRVNPASWTDAQFRSEFDVDDATKTVRPKVQP